MPRLDPTALCANKAKLYALLADTHPLILDQHISYFSTPDKVGAQFILAHKRDHFGLTIASQDQAEESFSLALSTSNYQSRGDWRWINQVRISHDNDLLLDIPLKPRVIDLPYRDKRINAHWFLHYMRYELDLMLKQLFQGSASHQTDFS